MEWFNPFGLVFITIIMIPNILFAICCKDGFANKYRNKTVKQIEQIGRFGGFGFMIFNIPPFWFGWASNETFALFNFLISGIMSRSIMLTVAALLFTPAHIFISYQNAKGEKQ